MKFSTVSTLPTLLFLTALSSLTLAASVTDNPTSALLTLLAGKVSNLDAAIASYKGNADADILTIQSASNALIITIDRGLRDISSGPDLTTAETKALVPQFEELTPSIKSTISDIVDKKLLFDRTETTICESDSIPIKKALHNQHAVWTKLSTLISSKAPEADSTLITGFAENILATIQAGLDPFVESTEACPQDTFAPPPPARIELRSYNSGNSSAPGNGSSTLVPVPVPSQTTAPGPPAFTGAAAVLAIKGGGMRVVGMGVFAAVVVAAL
ncbi:hydrophobic surface binding protein A-domain-containing protein [Aspergillus carlsbadensis]|nr:hydrophobic surface binding protein A-domain-containing protein [Aspergillus carlsbadensis]